MIEDLTGRKFGRLTVIRAKERKKGDKAYWVCECACGNEIVVNDYKLKKGHTKSCGCLRKNVNEYEFFGKLGIGYTAKGEKFFFDTEDFDKISNYYWGTNCDYIYSKKKIYMHRLLVDCPSDMVVDHINHNRKDNRKANLRICSQQENFQNGKLRANNTSKCTGVRRYNYNNRDCYVASISIKGKKKTLGYFETIDEAIRVRKEAEKEYYGKFAYNNMI